MKSAVFGALAGRERQMKMKPICGLSAALMKCAILTGEKVRTYLPTEIKGFSMQSQRTDCRAIAQGRLDMYRLVSLTASDVSVPYFGRWSWNKRNVPRAFAKKPRFMHVPRLFVFFLSQSNHSKTTCTNARVQVSRFGSPPLPLQLVS